MEPTGSCSFRDGFFVWAFIFGPLWLLWHRLWLALLAMSP